MRRVIRSLAILGSVVALLSVLCGTAQSAKLSEMLPMRDGVKLAADVYLPEGDGPWPVMLTRTPYNKNGFAGASRAIGNKGYVLVAQDVRGRFASEGEDWLVFSHGGWGEHQDGYDTVEWIAKQKWCNGKVGTFGSSAGGVVQNMMAPSRPPHLVCQWVHVASSNMYNQAMYQGGAFRKRMVEGWLKDNRFSPENLKAVRAHPEYDELWEELDPERVASQVNVPVMFVGGWYDIFCQGTINSFVTIQNKGDRGARGKCKLVMGPWAHGGFAELKYPNEQT
ncbi:CocE/NonD family hydrolase, partial [bacterium]|nr:CocE/NonD family hydrolase [bacterium]